MNRRMPKVTYGGVRGGARDPCLLGHRTRHVSFQAVRGSGGKRQCRDFEQNDRDLLSRTRQGQKKALLGSSLFWKMPRGECNRGCVLR
jgi:hypothetical protein